MEKILTFWMVIIITAIGITGCSSLSAPSLTPPNVTMGKETDQSPVWQGNTAAIWENLQHTSSSQLTAMLNHSQEAVQTAWLELALISKRKLSNQAFAQALLSWREHYPSHPGNALIPDNNTLNQLMTTPPPQHIALLLPLHGSYSGSGQRVREGFLNAYYANLPNISQQTIKFYDTTQTPNASVLYQQAVNAGADFIVGPLTKNDVQQLSASTTFTVPTLALNYTEIRFGSLSANFYEFGLLPEDETGQTAKKARESGLARAIIIAPPSAWGRRLVSAFTSQWQNLGGSIQDTWFYGARSSFNENVAHLLHIDPKHDKQLTREGSSKEILKQQRRQDFDVIFLFAQPADARLIVPLLRYYYANDIPIYATSTVYAGKNRPQRDVDLGGVIVCDIPQSETESDKLTAVGKDAYLLSQRLQRLIAAPSFPIYASTGALSLSTKHQIHRRLPCHAIQS